MYLAPGVKGACEIVLTMDGSGSVDSDEFANEQEWLKAIVQVHVDENRQGIVFFSSGAEIIYELDDRQTDRALQGAIDDVEWPGEGQSTMVSSMEKVVETFLLSSESGSHARRALIMTDSLPFNDESPCSRRGKAAIEDLVDLNVFVYLVFVGNTDQRIWQEPIIDCFADEGTDFSTTFIESWDQSDLDESLTDLSDLCPEGVFHPPTTASPTTGSPTPCEISHDGDCPDFRTQTRCRVAGMGHCMWRDNECLCQDDEESCPFTYTEDCSDSPTTGYPTTASPTTGSPTTMSPTPCMIEVSGDCSDFGLRQRCRKVGGEFCNWDNDNRQCLCADGSDSCPFEYGVPCPTTTGTPTTGSPTPCVVLVEHDCNDYGTRIRCNQMGADSCSWVSGFCVCTNGDRRCPWVTEEDCTDSPTTDSPTTPFPTTGSPTECTEEVDADCPLFSLRQRCLRRGVSSGNCEWDSENRLCLCVDGSDSCPFTYQGPCTESTASIDPTTASPTTASPTTASPTTVSPTTAFPTPCIMITLADCQDYGLRVRCNQKGVDNCEWSGGECICLDGSDSCPFYVEESCTDSPTPSDD